MPGLALVSVCVHELSRRERLAFANVRPAMRLCQASSKSLAKEFWITESLAIASAQGLSTDWSPGWMINFVVTIPKP